MESNSSNSNPGLSNQPPETIDHICYFIQRPRDILAFALTSKQIYSVAIPDHIDFRHLRCDFRRIHVWRKLAACPALASRFAALDIITENDEDELDEKFFNWWPMYLGLQEDETSDDSEGDELDRCEDVKEELEHNPHKISCAIRICMREFVAALKCMTGLTRFHWLLTQITPGKEITDALMHCPSIEDVDIVGIGGWYPGLLLDKGLAVCGPWGLSNLCRFSMHFDDDCEPKVTQEYTTNMINMLSRCPRLEELHIFPQHPNYLDTTQLLERGRWPLLKNFTLRYMSDDANRMLDAFLEAHPLLERLYITGHVAPNNRVWTVSLQNLRALHVVSMRNMTKIVSPITSQNLEYLSTIDLSLKPGGVTRHLQMLSQIPSLRSLTVRFPRPIERLLLQLAEVIPFIQRLHFLYDKSQVLDNEESTLLSCLTFISRLKCLTHLSNLIHIDGDENEVTRTNYIDTVVQRISKSSTTLRHLCLYNSNFYMELSTWVEIERNEEGMYTGWHYTTDLRGIHPTHWGDFFVGETIHYVGYQVA